LISRWRLGSADTARAILGWLDLATVDSSRRPIKTLRRDPPTVHRWCAIPDRHGRCRISSLPLPALAPAVERARGYSTRRIGPGNCGRVLDAARTDAEVVEHLPPHNAQRQARPTRREPYRHRLRSHALRNEVIDIAAQRSCRRLATCPAFLLRRHRPLHDRRVEFRLRAVVAFRGICPADELRSGINGADLERRAMTSDTDGSRRPSGFRSW